MEQGHAISDDDRRRGFGGTAVEEYGGSVDRDSSFGLSCFVVVDFDVAVGVRVSDWR